LLGFFSGKLNTHQACNQGWDLSGLDKPLFDLLTNSTKVVKQLFADKEGAILSTEGGY